MIARTRRPRGRWAQVLRLPVLVAGLALFGSACSESPYTGGATAPAPRRVARPTPRVSPSLRNAKPADAAEDKHERHPSMWRRKLKALYA